ncbi:MAG: ABC transporter ATP-binding protein [Acidimicrobiia bacterium]
MTDAVLEVSNVSLRFGGVSALNDVSFSVVPGELLAIIGPNGAGKTSVFNCINGVYKPQQGRITFLGLEINGRKPSDIAAMGLGRTFQNVGLFMNLDLTENLMLGRHNLMRAGFLASMLWWPRAKNEEAVHRAAIERITTLLGLDGYRGRPVGMLPYGVQKRIELGRALAMEPKLLLLDEPVAGMNGAESDEMATYIAQARRELGLAMVLVEHDMRVVMDLADRVLVLDFGTPIALGSPQQIKSDQNVIDAYLGRAG